MTRSVKTHKVAHNNQVRLCEQLLSVNSLSHERLLPVEEAADALAGGEHGATLGLLEDLMRCSFRVRPRKRLVDVKGRQVPFLGPWAPPPVTNSSDPVAPFETGVGVDGESWGAWGESGAPYSVRVNSKMKAGNHSSAFAENRSHFGWPASPGVGGAVHASVHEYTPDTP